MAKEMVRLADNGAMFRIARFEEQFGQPIADQATVGAELNIHLAHSPSICGSICGDDS
jgi:hypothetical protein